MTKRAWALALFISGLLLLPACKQVLPEEQPALAAVQTSDNSYQQAVDRAVSNSVLITAPPEEMVMIREQKAPAETVDTSVSAQQPSELPSEQMQQSEQENGNSFVAEAEQGELLPYVKMAINKIARSEGFREEHANIAYLLTYQQDGFISLLVEAEDDEGNVVLQTLNIDLSTGLEKPISAFFSGEDASWRGALADVVSEVAAQQHVTLLNDIPPVGDDQMFYVVGSGEIVLVYRPYEITTYQGGYPCFSLPPEALQEYATGAYGTCDAKQDIGETQ